MASASEWAHSSIRIGPTGSGAHVRTASFEGAAPVTKYLPGDKLNHSRTGQLGLIFLTASVLVLPLAAAAGAMTNESPANERSQQRISHANPGWPKVGAHVAREGRAPALLPLRSADDFVPNRLKIGQAPDSVALPVTPRIKAARQLQRLKGWKQGGADVAGTSCNGRDFIGKTGSSLISFIDGADLTTCMYSLYYGSVDDYRTVFSNANIITVADELKVRAVSYQGNDSNHSMNLLSFLRTAGYWSFMSKDGDKRNNIPPGDPTMMQHALSSMMQLIASPHFFDKTEDNAYFVSEVYKTVYSGWALSYAPSAKKWLDQVTPSTPAIGYWTNDAILQAMSVFYEGSFQSDYVDSVQNDISYAQSFDAFLTRNMDILGTEDSYHMPNAMGELIRFVQYAPLSTRVRSLASAQMPHFPVTDDKTIDVWMRASSMVDYYDSANCASYGTCNGQDTVASIKLPIRYECGSQYVLRAEAMTSAQLKTTCDSVTEEAKYFHGLMGTKKGKPVAKDKNKTLELVVFDNYDEYARFSGFLFGNSTDNGGIYLEGNPAKKGNQARFIAYRADWLADFEIWNLNHEFTHYLDGRYNMWGSFGDYPLSVGGGDQSSVWWIEGIAEYVSYSYRRQYYADATSRAQTAPVSLSEVMKNTYYSGSARVYNWGYLAARYIMERQPQEQKTFLPMMRVGDYDQYSAYIKDLGTSLDRDFSDWLTKCVSGGDLTSSSCVSNGQGTKPLLDPSAIGACAMARNDALDNGCSRELSKSGVLSYYIWNDDFAKSIFKLSKVAGSVDLYARAGSYPTTSNYDVKVQSTGQDVSITLPNKGYTYSYVMAVPKTGFSKATLRGMFSELPFPPGSKQIHCIDSMASVLAQGCGR
ncbi:collagenase [Ideonella sp. DXS29W]|uniref:microbial collagenase n=1 Tax=Ideonella lacteola TaxID=2984193 RepID=A0ABU9BY89_9BURK